MCASRGVSVMAAVFIEDKDKALESVLLFSCPLKII